MSCSNGSPQRLSVPEVSFDMRDKAYNICREFLSGEWKKITSTDMVFKTVSGGLSNLLYYCSLPATHTPLNGEPSQVLLRMYGQIHDSGESKITDSVITMLLSERKLGPKLYGIFPGGRLEEYIPARAMTCQELQNPLFSSTIARKLASVHSLNVPINKEPVWLLETMNRWLDNMRASITPDNIDTFDKRFVKDLCEFDYDSELRWLEKFLLSCNSPVIFSHNDLQEGNILLPEMSSTKTADRMVFIDFEFCSYNYRGFDVGNHFCERMFDYSNPEWPHYYTYLDQYPDEKTRRVFIREYLKQWNEKYSHILANNDPELNTEDHLLTEAEYFTLASHMLWTLWSINNALTSEIKFGYWEYGKTRLEEYLKHKNSLLKNLSVGNTQ